MNDYATTRAKALEVIREETVNGTTVGLLRVRRQGNCFLIMTSGGGTQRSKSERFVYEDFSRWVAAIGRRSA